MSGRDSGSYTRNKVRYNVNTATKNSSLLHDSVITVQSSLVQHDSMPNLKDQAGEASDDTNGHGDNTDVKSVDNPERRSLEFCVV